MSDDSVKIDCEDEPEWLTIAKAEIGQSEIIGSNDNPRIIEYLKSCVFPPWTEFHDEISWCSAFINWDMKRAGYLGTDSPAARSWLHYGKILDAPRLGCITILSRGMVWQGHVGLWLKSSKTSVTLLSGNTSNKVCIQDFPISHVLGYRWPVTGDKNAGSI